MLALTKLGSPPIFQKTLYKIRTHLFTKSCAQRFFHWNQQKSENTAYNHGSPTLSLSKSTNSGSNPIEVDLKIPELSKLADHRITTHDALESHLFWGGQRALSYLMNSQTSPQQKCLYRISSPTSRSIPLQKLKPLVHHLQQTSNIQKTGSSENELIKRSTV